MRADEPRDAGRHRTTTLSTPPTSRVALRFFVAYFLLYSPFLLVADLPGFAWLTDLWSSAWAGVVTRVAPHLFGISRPFPDTGDGFVDVRYALVRLACVVLLAILVTAAWSVLDRVRSGYPKLEAWLRVLVRYALASELLRYGLAKVFVTQFGATSLETLLEPLGQLAPRGLLWNFMAHSSGYTIFGGALECLGALLLLFRRTASLGALVLVSVMANVVMLDASYDVPVKTYAAHLLAMAVLLAAPDATRIVRLLVLRRTTEPPTDVPLFESPPARRASLIAKVCMIAMLVSLRSYAQAEKCAMKDGPSPALRGIWNVESSAPDTRWRRLVVDGSGPDPSRARVTLWRTDDTRDVFAGADDGHGAFVLSKGDAPATTLSYARTDDHMTLDGLVDGAPSRITLTRFDERELPLLARGFRWSVGDRLF